MGKIYLNNGQYYGVTTKMQGKMAGMYSLNTSPEVNPFCIRMRQIEGLICKSCFTKTTERRWERCHIAWVNNYRVLTENRLKSDELPVIRKDIFRFQAHGDLGNRTHYLNLISIAEANPKTTFALWTKRLEVVKRGGVVKLSNLIYIYSTPKLNDLNPILPEGFDKVFSVYTRPFTQEHNIAINCGARCCNECRKCYEHNDIVFVNEYIKYNGGGKAH